MIFRGRVRQTVMIHRDHDGIIRTDLKPTEDFRWGKFATTKNMSNRKINKKIETNLNKLLLSGAHMTWSSYSCSPNLKTLKMSDYVLDNGLILMSTYPIILISYLFSLYIELTQQKNDLCTWDILSGT